MTLKHYLFWYNKSYNAIENCSESPPPPPSHTHTHTHTHLSLHLSGVNLFIKMVILHSTIFQLCNSNFKFMHTFQLLNIETRFFISSFVLKSEFLHLLLKINVSGCGQDVCNFIKLGLIDSFLLPLHVILLFLHLVILVLMHLMRAL